MKNKIRAMLATSLFLLGGICLFSNQTFASKGFSRNKISTKSTQQDILIQFAPGSMDVMFTLADSFQLNEMTPGAKDSANENNNSAQAEILDSRWMHIKGGFEKIESIKQQLKDEKYSPYVQYIQPNYKIKLLENYQIQDQLRRAVFAKRKMQILGSVQDPPTKDNPDFAQMPAQKTGADLYLAKQWGMQNIGVADAWKVTMGSPDMIVAVIDTGIDYTHEDLLPNLWVNSKEIPNNNIDDDNNGYVDDAIGWDFVSNDNKPYDLAVKQNQLIMGGGNPGHGTHCAGNVGARINNSLGIAGVAPNVKIMGLRFISEKGEGTTAEAIKAIKYAVDNGAKVLSNSWGSEGEDPEDAVNNKALRDTIQYAQDHGVLFIAAAGNGHQGAGYDNDTDPNPAYPASYTNENIVSVAALDVNDQLGGFSNWGIKSVHIGAPGVDVFSTTVGNHYNNLVLDIGGYQVAWDGTSMAAPHVAGAAALYWSAHPGKSWKDVKNALLASAKKIPALKGKTVSEGKLDVKALLNY